MQYGDGLFGLLIVRDPDDPNKHMYDLDLTSHALLISDYIPETSNAVLLQLMKDSLPMPNSLPGDHGYSFSDTAWYGAVINGHNDDDPYNLTMDPKKRYRVRLVHGGSSWNMFVSIEKHNMTMIALDGSPIEPCTVNAVQLGPGDRVDVVIETGSGTEQTEFGVIVKYEGELLYNDGTVVPPSVPAKVVYRSSVAAGGAAEVQANGPLSPLPALSKELWSPIDTFEGLEGKDSVDYTLPPPKKTRSLQIWLGGNMKKYEWTLGDSMGAENVFEYPKYPATFPGWRSDMAVPITKPNANTSMSSGTLRYNFSVGEVVDIEFLNPNSMSHPMHIHGHQVRALLRRTATVCIQRTCSFLQIIYHSLPRP